MGLDITLEDERGQKNAIISDPHGLLMSLIYASVDDTSKCLRFIDPFGNTMFNRLQMEQLLTEIEGLHRSAKDPEQHELLREVEELVRQGQQEPHLYIKIYGD